jgi:nitroimidazol reductase NimA-like FMN-containing flavoprotein (pyridoxamine 5'-phosphate oxidase superfamily)
MTGSDESPPAPRGVRLSRDEAWNTIEHSHTGIFTTLRGDGSPIALPVWFVVIDRRIYMTTPSGTKKVSRVRSDARASFLVESGERWAELKAVHLTGRATVVTSDDRLLARVDAAHADKYAAFRTTSTKMPAASRQHYAQERAVVRFEPDERILSWDNARLFA